MKAEITQKLTYETISALVQQDIVSTVEPYVGIERRKYPRKPVTCVVEYWPADGNWRQPLIGECSNISECGLGMSCNCYIEPHILVGFAIYLDTACFHGLASVRYCKKVRDKYMVGLEFIFEE
jgi:hypothetical protein